MSIGSDLTSRLNTAFTAAKTNTAAVNAALGATGTSNSTLDQTAFLKLFTTQLKNQDPFEPMDNSQMVAQMAQFSSVAGISEMNSALKNISTELSSSRIAAASSWIGRSMLVKSNVATPDKAGQYGGQFTLGADSGKVSVDLIDGSGNVLKTLDLGAQAKGDVSWYWDGTDGAGNRLSSDAVRVRVNGGAATNAATWASIAGVQSPADASQTKLLTPLGTFAPEDAIKIG